MWNEENVNKCEVNNFFGGGGGGGRKTKKEIKNRQFFHLQRVSLTRNLTGGLTQYDKQL